ncbi:hypothetical protein M9Y10_044010 [Tritrichomonas musculus]|uniref:Protein kinase domain-containing protein n=1 Tax=Tritrichomonas musculus TaxID=1915356 RepID=A0ABR2K1C5_9EUKA
MDYESEPFYNEGNHPPSSGVINGYQIDGELEKPTNCSFIYLGSSQQNNQKKVIKFVKLIKKKIDRIKNEIETMSIANHPNILRMDECFRLGPFACIITPYAPYKSLFHLVVTQYPSGIPENIAVIIFRQMLQAVHYLHGVNIWHRDIKPDNFLVFDSHPEHPSIVLADFGFAKKFQEGELGNDFFGTPEYTAPEIFSGTKYEKSVDIYSLGVTLFVLLTARYPVPSFKTARDECKRRIRKGLLNYQLLVDMEISPDAVDLIRQMCRLDPTLRITAEDALNHPWIVSSQKENAMEGDISNALWEGENYQFEPPGV